MKLLWALGLAAATLIAYKFLHFNNNLFSELVIASGLLIALFWPKQSEQSKDVKNVPEVEGGLPIIGHGLTFFFTDIVAFIESCYQKYGPVFKLKIFRVSFIIVCDRTMASEFFKSPEPDMSLYDVLGRLYFSDAFSDKELPIATTISVIKKSILVKSDEFLGKIETEAKRLIESLKAKVKKGSKVDLTHEVIRFVSGTSALCFVGVPLSEETFQHLYEFTNYLNSIVIRTYFFPKWILRIMYNRQLSKIRKQVTKALAGEIEKYRKDKEKSDSLLLRVAADTISEDTGDLLSNQEIGDIVICLLYVSSENTALGLVNAILDLAQNPDHWERARTESAQFLSKGDLKGLISSKYLNACILETARMNSHVFAIGRRPRDKTILGGYNVSDVDTVAFCEPMMQVFGSASNTFTNPKRYNPNRFLGDEGRKPEPLTSSHIMTWGSGLHHCPGRTFALFEIKVGVALFLQNFKIDTSKNLIPELDYFSPSAFAERKAFIELEPLSEEDNFIIPLNQPENFQTFNIGALTIDRFSVDDHKVPHHGFLIRNYISRQDQIEFYQSLVELSLGSVEHLEILEVDQDQQFPFAYDNLAYTGSSNLSRPPTIWYNWAGNLWEILMANKELLGFQGPQVKAFNSLYCQLFGTGGQLGIHKDKLVSWGISVNLGGSATFGFDDHKILLHSGDVFIADFSKVSHGVECVSESGIPDWFSEDMAQVETFGRLRCSVQIRAIENFSPTMTIDEFKKMLKAYKQQ